MRQGFPTGAWEHEGCAGHISCSHISLLPSPSVHSNETAGAGTLNERETGQARY